MVKKLCFLKGAQLVRVILIQLSCCVLFLSFPNFQQVTCLQLISRFHLNLKQIKVKGQKNPHYLSLIIKEEDLHLENEIICLFILYVQCWDQKQEHFQSFLPLYASCCRRLCTFSTHQKLPEDWQNTQPKALSDYHSLYRHLFTFTQQYALTEDSGPQEHPCKLSANLALAAWFFFNSCSSFFRLEIDQLRSTCL